MSHYKDADLDFAFGGSTAPPEQSSPQRSVPDIKRLHQRKNLHKADVSQTDSSLPECLHRDPDGEGITSLTETSNVRSAGSAVPISLTVEEEAAIQTFSASFVQPPLATGQQKDAENDARTQVPYRINRETFKVPLVCPDDLVAGTDKMWCPGKPLRIAYVTWNMAGKKPRAGEVSSFCIHPNAHIVVVGTQENGGYLIGNRKQKKWLKEITTNCLKNNYKLVKATHMWALHLAVFARDRDVAAYVSHAHTADVSTGTCGWGGNKGGVAVALSLSMLRPDNSLVATPMKANRDYFSTSLERDTTIKKVSPAKQAKTDGNESGGAQIKEGELERVPSAASAGCDKDSSRKASFGANTEEQMAEEAAEQNGTHEQSVYSSPEEVFCR
ncbi:endonuclease/Exonuclease/phosphatase [Angomonas deanei]|uniref:Inositol polyphosphate-related phosphatase domain-containing protein n=1 Tax=Angomonas deanei TaxID=59799 RepID=A0A7G2C330_9TRYP|nr:endonuclease/Exonuclease/phosphatase [Angomonas deanei]CAD2214208.1 hypothetical protein, conserved [Angomonas deanei]|eukprot:EPY20031.1 endonuclease/Exonuclease/phosphatase [Angomonas deanei]